MSEPIEQKPSEEQVEEQHEAIPEELPRNNWTRRRAATYITIKVSHQVTGDQHWPRNR